MWLFNRIPKYESYDSLERAAREVRAGQLGRMRVVLPASLEEWRNASAD